MRYMISTIPTMLASIAAIASPQTVPVPPTKVPQPDGTIQLVPVPPAFVYTPYFIDPTIGYQLYVTSDLSNRRWDGGNKNGITAFKENVINASILAMPITKTKIVNGKTVLCGAYTAPQMWSFSMIIRGSSLFHSALLRTAMDTMSPSWTQARQNTQCLVMDSSCTTQRHSRLQNFALLLSHQDTTSGTSMDTCGKADTEFWVAFNSESRMITIFHPRDHSRLHSGSSFDQDWRNRIQDCDRRKPNSGHQCNITDSQ